MILRGRFAGGVHPALDAINRSYAFDCRMWFEDIEGSRAHARMLAATAVLPQDAVENILSGLDQVAREFELGTFAAQDDDEDIHMAVERRLVELIGEGTTAALSHRSKS